MLPQPSLAVALAAVAIAAALQTAPGAAVEWDQRGTDAAGDGVERVGAAATFHLLCIIERYLD